MNTSEYTEHLGLILPLPVLWTAPNLVVEIERSSENRRSGISNLNVGGPMNSRPTPEEFVAVVHATNAAVLAVLMTREVWGVAYTADEIADDACKVVLAAMRVREAIRAQVKPTPAELERIKQLLGRYGVEVVAPLDPGGMAVGARFPGQMVAGRTVHFIA